MLTANVANQIIVVRGCNKAAQSGVRYGMTLGLARSLIESGGLKCLSLPYNAQAEMRALYQLGLRWTIFSPVVALDSDLIRAYRGKAIISLSRQYYGLALDITGLERCYSSSGADGIKTLIDRISAWSDKAEIALRFAIAPTIGAAWALSRYASSSQHSIRERSHIRAAVEELPIGALRVSNEVRTALNELGIVTISQLLKLPHKQLLTRFGINLVKRIDQLFGAIIEPLAALSIPKPFRVTRRFFVPINRREALVRITTKMVCDLLRNLKRSKRVAQSFLLFFEGSYLDRTPQNIAKEIALISATSNEAALTSVLGAVLEELTFPSGVHSITVSAKYTRRASESQLSCDNGAIVDADQNQQARGDLLNHLAVKFGHNRVSQVRLKNSHLPERSFEFVPIALQTNRSAAGAAAVNQPVLAVLDRPPLLLAEPEPIAVTALLPDSPPSQLIWQGRRYRLLRGVGPERIAQEWWKELSLSGNKTRDYFKVQDSTGRWLWIFREGELTDESEPARWFMHGIWG